VSTFTVSGEPTCVSTDDRSVSAYWIDLDGEPDGIGHLPTVKLWVRHDRGRLLARLSDTRTARVVVGDDIRIRAESFSLLGGGRRRERTEPLARFSRPRFDRFYADALTWAATDDDGEAW
jgi:hypothetical protein